MRSSSPSPHLRHPLNLVLAGICLCAPLVTGHAQNNVLNPPPANQAPAKLPVVYPPAANPQAGGKPAPKEPASATKPAAAQQEAAQASPAKVAETAPAAPPSAPVSPAAPAVTPPVAAPPVVVEPAAGALAPDAAPGAAAAEPEVSPEEAEPIDINIDGHVIDVDPMPLMVNGSVLVPLRGVLEYMGAVLSYNDAEKRIDIKQGTQTVSLRIGQPSAIVGTNIVPLSAAPQIIGDSTFVPLRSLAQLFGYEVQWIPASRLVAVVSKTGGPRSYSDHRVALRVGGPFGIEADFSDATTDEADALLNAAKNAGAGIIKTRFDWNTLEPAKGKPFQWPIYDYVVRAARERGLIVVGILGNSAKWASVYSRSNNPDEWRNGPPRDSELPAWQNYVRRVVGRYGNDVHAWQVWEGTSSDKFRSGFKNYIQVLGIAGKTARQADPNAIVHTSDPGGVDLGYIETVNNYVGGNILSGVALYPAAGFQPGVPAAPEAFLRPFDTLRGQPAGKGRDLWVGGLSWPVLGEAAIATGIASAAGKDGPTPTSFEPISTNGTASSALAAIPGIAGADSTMAKRLLNTYTPEAQADYLVRSATLALAAGSGKVFWGSLRDDSGYARVEPVNPDFGSGLLRRDFSPRPSFAAYRTLTRLISNKKYLGSLALGPDAIALVFDNGREGSAIVWGLTGKATLTFNSLGTDPLVPNSVFVATRADSQVLDSTGVVLAGSSGSLALTSRPVWITKIGAKFALALKARKKNQVVLAPRPVDWSQDDGVKATFDGSEGSEHGIYWRPYTNFRSAAQNLVQVDGRTGLSTRVSNDIYNPAAGKFFIFLDIADEYMYFARGKPVEVTIEVHRPRPVTGLVTTTTAGFNIQYDSPGGFKYTPWQVIEPGEGWATYTFRLPDASFANRNGFDLMINTFGSKQNTVFGSIKVKKLPE